MSDYLRSLLDQFRRYNNRGNMTDANRAMAQIIEGMLDQPCQCKSAPRIHEEPVAMHGVPSPTTLAEPAISPSIVTRVKRGRGRPRKTTAPQAG